MTTNLDIWIANMRKIADVGAVFVGTDGEFPVNAEVLKVRSEVFAKMLSGDWAERDGRISIPYSVAVLRHFYQHIKTGIVDETITDIKLIVDLAALGDQYMMTAFVKSLGAYLTKLAGRFIDAHNILRCSYESNKDFTEQYIQVDKAFETIYKHIKGKGCIVRDCNCKSFKIEDYADVTPIVIHYCYYKIDH